MSGQPFRPSGIRSTSVASSNTKARPQQPRTERKTRLDQPYAMLAAQQKGSFPDFLSTQQAIRSRTFFAVGGQESGAKASLAAVEATWKELRKDVFVHSRFPFHYSSTLTVLRCCAFKNRMLQQMTGTIGALGAPYLLILTRFRVLVPLAPHVAFASVDCS